MVAKARFFWKLSGHETKLKRWHKMRLHTITQLYWGLLEWNFFTFTHRCFVGCQFIVVIRWTGHLPLRLPYAINWLTGKEAALYFVDAEHAIAIHHNSCTLGLCIWNCRGATNSWEVLWGTSIVQCLKFEKFIAANSGQCDCSMSNALHANSIL